MQYRESRLRSVPVGVSHGMEAEARTEIATVGLWQFPPQFFEMIFSRGSGNGSDDKSAITFCKEQPNVDRCTRNETEWNGIEDRCL